MKELKPIHYLFIGLGTVGAVLAFRSFSKTVKNTVSEEKSKKAVADAEKEIKPALLSYPLPWYSQSADKMYVAMSGVLSCESTVFGVLEALKVKEDWYKLVSAFGVRETGAWYSKFSGNLIEWIQKEMDDAEKSKVKAILGKIKVQY